MTITSNIIFQLLGGRILLSVPFFPVLSFLSTLLGVSIYSLFAALGLRHSTWWLVVGWLAHPVWDIGLHVAGSGTTYAPVWSAIACLSFDLTVAIYILIGILQRQPWSNYGGLSKHEVI